MPAAGKDKRNFKRYCTKSSLKLDINGRAYNANAVDYSFDGIGAVVENARPIAKGASVNVHMDNPVLDAKGEVAWIQKTPQGLTVGIKEMMRRVEAVWSVTLWLIY